MFLSFFNFCIYNLNLIFLLRTLYFRQQKNLLILEKQERINYYILEQHLLYPPASSSYLHILVLFITFNLIFILFIK